MRINNSNSNINVYKYTFIRYQRLQLDSVKKNAVDIEQMN